VNVFSYIKGFILTFSHSDSSFGLGSGSVDFLDALTSLSHCIHIWPNPTELVRSGHKLLGIEQLDKAAKLTQTSRPATEGLRRSGAKPPKGNYVLKREFSACASHVHFIRQDSSPTWAQIDGRLPSPYRWIRQEVAPLLRQWGEWRLFIVDRRVCACIMTSVAENGDWDWCAAKFGYSLKQLR
jgi:hypothetical protein